MELLSLHSTSKEILTLMNFNLLKNCQTTTPVQKWGHFDKRVKPFKALYYSEFSRKKKQEIYIEDEDE